MVGLRVVGRQAAFRIVVIVVKSADTGRGRLGQFEDWCCSRCGLGRLAR